MTKNIMTSPPKVQNKYTSKLSIQSIFSRTRPNYPSH